MYILPNDNQNKSEGNNGSPSSLSSSWAESKPLHEMMINSPCAHDDDNDAVQPHRFTRSCAEYSILGAAVMATITGTATNLNLISNDAKY